MKHCAAGLRAKRSEAGGSGAVGRRMQVHGSSLRAAVKERVSCVELQCWKQAACLGLPP